MKEKKILKICAQLILLLIVGWVIWFGINFAPGSYPYAERYEIRANEKELIQAIEKFKEENPQFSIPPQSQLSDGKRDKYDHWFHVYFYYPQENQIVKTWTRSIDNSRTTFAFVAINEGIALGNWKEINNDFGYSENKAQKRKFEQRILNRIKEKIDK